MNNSEQEIVNGCGQETVNDVSEGVHSNDVGILDQHSAQVTASDPAEQQAELLTSVKSVQPSSVIDQATDSDAVIENQTAATLSDMQLTDSQNPDVNEHENLDQTEEQEFDWSYVDDSEQYYGWICQGDEDGYAYYTDPDGILYSVDQSGFWYFQDETDAEFQPCQETVVSIAMKMYPLNAHGQPVLPINAHGEKIFPTDANHMPIFPIDHSTQLPTFPVDDYGQPVFPTGTDGRPIVPVDGNGAAIFPVDGTGQFIFPSGANGTPVAPVDIYGVPVLPRDATGKPVIPYDDHGMPLIHLASDGITPLTEEEYQYSLQWHDYYGSYNQYYALVHNPIQQQQVAFGVPSLAMGVNTLEQAPERSLKFLKKVRPEDIDLPLTALPPQPSDAVPISMTPDCAKPQPEPPLAEEVEQQKAAEELKAKTKRLMEMQLRFTRKTPGFGIGAKTNTTDSVGKKKSEESKPVGNVGEKDSNENDWGDKTANDSMDVSSRSVELNGNAYDMMTANESVADNTEASTTPKAASPETVPAPNDVRSTTSPGDTNHPSMELDTQNEESNETTTTLEPAFNHDDNQAISVEEKSAQMVETNQSSLNENENEDSGRPTISNGKESAAVDNEAVLFVETSEADPKKLSQPISLLASSKPESLPASQSIPSLSKPSNEQRSVSKSKSDPLGDILNEYPVSTRSNSSLSNVSQSERQHGQISSHRPAASFHSRQEPSRDQEPPQSQQSIENNNHQYDHESRNSRSRSSTYPRYLYESPSPEIHHSSYRPHSQSPKQQEPASSRSPNRPYSGSKSPNRSVRESRTRHHSKHERSSSRTQRHVRREKSSRKRSRSCSPSRSISRTQSSRRAGWEHSEHSSNRRHHSLAESRSRELSPHDQSVSREPERSTSLERSGSVSSVQSSNLSITILSNSGKPSTRIVRSSTHSKHSTEHHQNRSPGEISSIAERSENGEQIRSQMNSKETKKDRKKKHRKQSSSSRRSRKIKNLEASGTLSAKKNGREAVEQTVEDLVSRENDLEREKDGAKQDSNSYGPQPPKQVTAEDAETDDRVKGLKTKDSKCKKDKSEKKKKRRKRKKKGVDLSETEEKDESKDAQECEQQDENATSELNGVEPGEILERDQEPTPTSFVDESEGLSVVFIGPKWDTIATRSEQTRVMTQKTDEQNKSKEVQPPKQFYQKYIRETLTTPIITFTSNPLMAESFSELKRQFDDSDGPRRFIQASKQFQTAMGTLSESSLGSKEAETVIPQVAATEQTEPPALSKWKSFKECRRERHHERRKAKKEKKLKKRAAREKEQLLNAVLNEDECVVAERSEASDRGDEESGELLWYNADVPSNDERQKTCNIDKSVDTHIRDRDMATDDASEAVSEAQQKRIRHESLNDAVDDGSFSTTERHIEQESEPGELEPAAKRPKHTQSETIATVSESRKVEKGTQADEERVAYKREIIKRRMEEEEEDELSRLRYEALRSKTKRLMNDLRSERRRLKRERLRATLAMRRARGYDDEISVDDILMVADTSESSNTDESGDGLESRAEKIISIKKKQLIKRARLEDAATGVDSSSSSSRRNSRFKSSNAEQNNEKIPNSFGESNDDGLTTAQRGTADTVVNTPQKSTTTSQDGSDSSHNHLITELQKCIGGSNRGALQLLEQLKKSLMAGRSSNIHLNPERIRNSP